METTEQIQEQAEKLYPEDNSGRQLGLAYHNNDLQLARQQAWSDCAQWMQEREKPFIDHVNKINLTQRDKDLIKGVYYEFLSLPSPPKD